MRRCLGGAASEGRVPVERTRIPAPPTCIRCGTPEIQNTAQRFRLSEIHGGSERASPRFAAEVNAARLCGDVVEVNVSEEHSVGGGSGH